MALRRIILMTDTTTRLVVYPEGGYEVEIFVAGPGWVLGTDEIGEAECAALLEQAAALLRAKADQQSEVVGDLAAYQERQVQT